MCKLFDDLSEPIQIRIVAFPLVIILDMDYFSLHVAAMNRPLGYIQAIQAIHKDTRHAFGKTDFTHLFQLGQTQFKRLNKILHIHGIFAGLVQEEL